MTDGGRRMEHVWQPCEALRQRWTAEEILPASAEKNGSEEEELTEEDDNDEREAEFDQELCEEPKDTQHSRCNHHHHLVLSMCLLGSRVGCAMYKQQFCTIETFEVELGASTLHQCETILAAAGAGSSVGPPGLSQQVPVNLYWLLRLLASYPTSVLLPHSGAELLEGLVALYGSGGGRHSSCVMKLHGKSAFSVEAAVPRLIQLYPNTTEEVWAARLQLQHRAMLSALSALLQFTSSVLSNVINVVETSEPKVLYVEEHTARFLQLTRSETHPCDYQGVGRAKEGLSLLSVLQQTQSPGGREKLRQWFQMPSRDRDVIQERQEVVRFFCDPSHHELLHLLRRAIHRVHPTEGIFNHLRSGKANLTHYRRLLETMRQYERIYDLLKPVAHHLPFLQRLMGSFTLEPLVAMAHQLEQTIAGLRSATRRGTTTQEKPAHQGGKHTAAAAAAGGVRSGRVWPRNATAYSDVGGKTSVRVRGVAGVAHVQAGVDPSGLLDELRARLSEMDLSLEKQREEVWRRLSGVVQHYWGSTLECVYLPPPHGYLLAVDQSAVLELAAAVLSLGDHPESGGPRIPREEATKESTTTATLRKPPECPSQQLPRPPYFSSSPSLSSPSPQEKVPVLLQWLAETHGLVFHHEEDNAVLRAKRRMPHSASPPPRDGAAAVWYFKSAEMFEMDEFVGDLRERIRLREAEIQWELDRQLVLHLLYLLPSSEPIAELDCLLGFAMASQAYGWSPPELLETAGELHIDNGWHPVLGCALGRHAVVPFSLTVGQTADRICLFLGAHSSGKSVVLSAVALMVFMAQLGCFVPAERLRLSVMGSVLAASPVPCQRGGSSFYAECVALGRTLDHCAAQRHGLELAAAAAAAAAEEDERAPRRGRRPLSADAGGDGSALPGSSTTVAFHTSLVLVDELGKGTAPDDGRALLGSVLRYFAGVSPFSPPPPPGSAASSSSSSSHSSLLAQWRPIVLCATHFVEMLEEPQRGLSLHRHGFPAFPFEAVQLYDMQTVAVYRRRRRPRKKFTGGCSAAATTGCCEALMAVAVEGAPQLPVDVLPTFTPLCLTHHPTFRLPDETHEAAYFRYFYNVVPGATLQSTAGVGGKAIQGGPALGRRCGLSSWLQHSWESTVGKMLQCQSLSTE